MCIIILALRFSWFWGTCSMSVGVYGSGAKVCVSMCRYISGRVCDWIWWFGITMSGAATVSCIYMTGLLSGRWWCHGLWRDLPLSPSDCTSCVKISRFSQQLIGKSGEMRQNSTSCVIFSAFLDTSLRWISSSHKKRPFLLRQLTFSSIFPFFRDFGQSLQKKRDSFARINQAVISGLSDVFLLIYWQSDI